MTHINNKNIINIKIDDKKKNKKKRRRNTKTKSSHINAPYNSVASLITNRPQYLDTSTASSREKEAIITNAINKVKHEKEILLIKDKDPSEKTLLIKDKNPLTAFESPVPKPISMSNSVKKITDFFPQSPEKNLDVSNLKDFKVTFDDVDKNFYDDNENLYD
jgi:hypothetical protein